MITVIADDITGAAEIAGICLRYELTVRFGIDSVPDPTADVRIIATDTRSLTETEAYKIHQQLANEICKSASFLFKKCDSVLRGFVLTELMALLKSTGKSSIVLQPANPATGRIIQNGQYYIGNELIEKTGFNIDPDFPATSSNVQTLLAERSTLFGKNIPIYTTQNQAEAQNSGLYISDCNSTADMQQCLSGATHNTLLAGSAAFFEQVLMQKFPDNKEINHSTNTISTNYLLVGGSTHPQSLQLISKLQSEDCPVYYFPEYLLTETIHPDAISNWGKELISVWEKHRKMVLSISTRKISFPQSSTILKNRLNALVSLLINHCTIEEMLIEGGATTYSILRNLNWNILKPVKELAPGVIRMQVIDKPSVFLTIKPGSYCWPTDLIQQ